MCQAIKDGGRRCPIHRRETLIASAIAERDTGLNQAQVSNLFTELRREGRHTIFNDEGYWHAYLDSLALRSPDLETRQEVFAARDEADVPDTATMYALRRLHSRSAERARNLTAHLQTIADRKGWSLEETKEKFEDYHAATELSRRGVPEGYTVSAVRTARSLNLPQDKQSIAALGKLESEEVETERVPRITRKSPEHTAFIKEFGYEGGRLEIVFEGDPDRVYAYQNVPESTWEAISTSDNPDYQFTSLVRGREDYAYTSQEEAEADAYRIRCSGCGQFIARTGGHSCPDRVEEEASESPAPAEVESVTETAAKTTEPAEEVATQEEQAPVEETAEVAPETPVEEPSAASTINEAAVEEQRNPQPLEMPPPKHEFANYYNGRSLEAVNSSSWRLARYEGQLSDEDLERIKNAPEHATFLIRPEADENGENLYRTTPDGQRMMKYEVAFADPEGQYLFHRDYISGRTLVYPALKRQEDDGLTRDERIAASDKEREKRQELVDAGKIVELETTASATRTYRVDGNRPEAPQISWAKVRDFRRAINEGKTVTASVSWSFSRPRRSGNLPLCDDQGYSYPKGGYNEGEVYGNLTMRRKEDGTMELVHSERSLRCNCYYYRRNYRCEHVDYVARHAPNLGQQMMEPSSSGRPRRAPAARVPSVLGDLPSTLANRPDFTILPATEDRGTHISLTGGNYRNRRTSLAENLPTEFDTSTEEGKKELYRTRMMVGSSITAPPSSIINRALRYAPVETIVSLTYGGAGGIDYSATISGSVTLKKEEDGTVTVAERRLRCYCYDYRNNYDCIHIREVQDSYIAHALTSTTGVDSDAENAVSSAHSNMTYGMERSERRRLRDAVFFNTSIDNVDNARAEYSQEIETRRAQREEEERAARRAEAARQAAIREAKHKEAMQAFENHHARIRQNWENREPGYAENPEEFEKDYREALSRKRKGESPIAFRTENVLDGMASGEGSRGFGVELEFEIKDGVNRSEALRKIGQDLHAAGLTNTAGQQRYHAAENNGYKNWSFEKDCTVHGELVSPILKDTPEDWKQLQTAVEIVKKHGGVATLNAGSHVHVSTGSYMDSTAKHAELLRTVRANEDTIYRVASNPAVGRHRGTSWCRPNAIENNSDEVISKDVKEGHSVLGRNAHGRALNLTGSAQNDPNKSHVEFRTWDGTLDPAVIQQQIAFSVAMVEKADRAVEEKGSSSPVREVRSLGSHRNGSRLDVETEKKLRGAEFQKHHGHVAGFIDSLFRRKEDRKNASALFAITNWQS